MNLPKQWRDWCRAAKLRPSGRYSKNSWQWFYLKGRGRYWRVNSKFVFECGDTYGEFDRWALCTVKSAPIPRSKQEFINTVRKLLEAHGS